LFPLKFCYVVPSLHLVLALLSGGYVRLPSSHLQLALLFRRTHFAGGQYPSRFSPPSLLLPLPFSLLRESLPQRKLAVFAVPFPLGREWFLLLPLGFSLSLGWLPIQPI
jgi:hypothetical protein